METQAAVRAETRDFCQGSRLPCSVSETDGASMTHALKALLWPGSRAPSPQGSSHTTCFLVPAPLLGSLLPSPALPPLPAFLLLSQVRG